MKKGLITGVICALVLSTVSAWAAFPTHKGDANPVNEGWNSEGTSTFGSPGTSPANWTITDDGSNYLLYYASYSPGDVPLGNWKWTWTMKMDAASAPFRPVVSLGDGLKMLQYHFSVAPDGTGTVYMLNEGGQRVSLGTFVNGNGYHTWSAQRLGTEGPSVDIYLDGTYFATTRYMNYYSYPGYSTYFGTAGPGPACTTQWTNFELITLAEPGDLAGNITLENYTGDKSIVPVKIEILQNGAVQYVTNLILASDGTFTFKNIPAGTYDVRFTACKFLRKTIVGVVITAQSQMALAPFTLLNGDVDGDNEVTSTDLSSSITNIDKIGD